VTDRASRFTVEQFLPTFDARDAVGNHTRATHEVLRGARCGGGIWAEHVNPDLLADAARYQGYDRRARSDRRARRLLHYQASIGTEGLVDFLLRRREPLSLYYHNMTPASFLDAYDAVVAGLLRRGREELLRIAPRARVALAASRFNAAELREAGAEHVQVMPPYSGPALTAEPDPEHLARLREGRRDLDLLFVGRLAPHKGHRHLIRALAAMRGGGGGLDARLFLVGAAGPAPYMTSLTRLIERLGLQRSVIVTGSVPEPVLAAHYRAADIYLCLSEHEGFGLPLLDAMRAEIPVVAYDAAAVGETLGGAGVLIRTLDPMAVAEVVAWAHRSEDLREELCAGQRRRAHELDTFPRADVLLRSMEMLAEG
jgi:glycosyltransferase involved in cell wall biosynthesis